MPTLANTLVDALQTMKDAAARGDTWTAALGLCRRLGAMDFNVAEFSEGEYLPNWWRSSLTTHVGHEEYVQEGYATVDPVLHARLAGRVGELWHLEAKNMPIVAGQEAMSRSLQALFLRYDADSFFCFAGQGLFPGAERLLSFSTSRECHGALAGLGRDGLSLIGNVIAEHVVPPTAEDAEGHIGFLYDLLSSREHDALCYLASGLSNDQIAHRMGIAEVTVRHHVKNARRKMGARTREQAIAKAIVRGQLRL
ncbi:helix-turn-helix transcriptional regulator [Poseidonocella sp. HB161398]|uniref:helix-turn-helix transcriptional regulator n=1 Tax=Poseidonocella sp. HB161398 TaxID=2320855 RepID=UPI0014868B67|nr:helix-turn-helix transcriptional regulator [Poseidonocella sp. HB161398]